MQCWTDNSRPHRCLRRTHSTKLQTYKDIMALAVFGERKKLQSCEDQIHFTNITVQWPHLMGWAPKTIPLQFSAIMALSACSQNQKIQKGKELKEERSFLVCTCTFNCAIGRIIVKCFYDPQSRLNIWMIDLSKNAMHVYTLTVACGM